MNTERPEGGAGRPASILVVDDLSANLQLLTGMLKDHGYKARPVPGGKLALQAARSEAPDLILLDINMPEMNGYEVCQHLKADETLRGIPVIFISALNENLDKVKAFAVGGVDYLTNPFQMEELHARVETHLKLRRLQVALEETNARLAKAYKSSKTQVRERTAELSTANDKLLKEIEERKRAEEELRLRNRAFEAILQGVIITDPSQPDNPIIYTNPAFEKITGYTRAESQGLNCRFLQGPGTDPAAAAEIRAAILQNRSCLVELLNYRKDGTPFWNSLSLAPVFDDGGKASHFVGVQTDVTPLKNLEEQFRQAQKMEAFGQLAGGVAHDFNNLLTVISGYSELMLETLSPDDQNREMLQEVHKAAERAALLTRQLLTFSRRQVIQPQVVDLNAVVASSEKMLGRLIGEDVDLTTVPAAGLEQVKVDPGQIEQVIMNLVVNARDAMPQGGRITIETANVDLDDDYGQSHAEVKPGRYVLLAVSDTGSGMTEEVKRHIFEPFFTTKEVGKGTGLGLATVFGIVKQSGGHVRVYSEAGRGTSFKIYFPSIVEMASAGRAKEEPSPVRPGVETILVVEDETAVRSLTRLTLQSKGYVLLEAADGEEAIRLCERRQEPIRLLVTDVVMPGMGGRQLVERLTALHPEMRVLFVSGYTDDAVVRHGVLQAEVAFLQKPFTMDALLRKVRAALDGPP